MPCVYILQSEKNGRYYVGSCTDIERRLEEHSRGNTKSTRVLLPCKLIFTQEYSTIQVARKIERRIKKLKSKLVIEKILFTGKISMEL